MTPRIALFAAVFSVVAGGVLAWYAFFKPSDSVPATSLAITAYVDPPAKKRRCVRRLVLVLTVRNTASRPATIADVRFLAGQGTSLDAGVSRRRIGAEKQAVLRFDVAPIYARLRRERIGRSITRVEVRDGSGVRYRRPVGLNSDARICGQ